MNVQQNVALAPHTSLHVGGTAENLIEVSGQELVEAIEQATKPIWVLGAATNCLISDQGLPGTVIFNQGGEITQINPTTLRVDSGVSWDDFVKKAIELGLYGLEFSSGIPGNVGAAVVGNIAAYGHRVSNHLTSAELFDTETSETTTWSNADFGFDYRTSNLQMPAHKNLVVLNATFEFSTTGDKLEYRSALRVADELNLTPDTLANRRAIILEVRKRAGSLLTNKSTGPWTAGSFFKNPIVTESQLETIVAHEEADATKEQVLQQNQIHSGQAVRVSAALVLLAAGFKRGQTWGQVRLHPDHILKIENIGQASAQDIYDVVQEIIQTVKDKLSITLEPEVRFLGEF